MSDIPALDQHVQAAIRTRIAAFAEYGDPRSIRSALANLDALLAEPTEHEGR